MIQFERNVGHPGTHDTVDLPGLSREARWHPIATPIIDMLQNRSLLMKQGRPDLARGQLVLAQPETILKMTDTGKGHE